MVDATARCWGSNEMGQLGDGTTTDRLVPAPVPGLTNVVEVVTTGYHTCARAADMTVRCWGRNEESQLGDGTTINRTAPVLVAF